MQHAAGPGKKSVAANPFFAAGRPALARTPGMTVTTETPDTKPPDNQTPDTLVG
jgi:hypothetical protein